MDTRVGVKRIDCGSNSGRGIAYRRNWSQFAKTNANSNRKFIAFDIDGSNHLLHLFAYFIILPFKYLFCHGKKAQKAAFFIIQKYTHIYRVMRRGCMRQIAGKLYEIMMLILVVLTVMTVWNDVLYNNYINIIVW